MSDKKFYPIVFDEQSFDAIKDCVAWCANNRPLEPSDRTYLMDLSNDLAPHVPVSESEMISTVNSAAQKMTEEQQQKVLDAMWDQLKDIRRDFVCVCDAECSSEKANS